MARPLRIELAGGLYHVTSRGDRREAIYCNDEDRQAWLALMYHAIHSFIDSISASLSSSRFARYASDSFLNRVWRMTPAQGCSPCPGLIGLMVRRRTK
jgi:hypothetical protein